MILRQCKVTSGALLAQFCAAPLKRTNSIGAGAKRASALFKWRTSGTNAVQGYVSRARRNYSALQKTGEENVV